MPGLPLFDVMQRTVFSTANRLFGVEAAWTPSGGGATFTGQLLLNNPTERMQRAGVDFDPIAWRGEYSYEQFPGLRESVDAGEAEKITIAGQGYWVSAIHRKHDGNTYIAYLTPETT